MKKIAFTIGVFISVLVMADLAYCDRASPLVTHFNNARERYKAKDYDNVIYEACNALYHQRQKSQAYFYLAKSYEKLKKYELALISYLKFQEYCSGNDKIKVQTRINELKSLLGDEKFERIGNKNAEILLSKEGHYKKSRLYRMRDYIYSPLGDIIEEKYCRPNNSYEYKVEYIYDSAGQIVEKIKYDDNGAILESEHLTYENGKNVQIVTKDANGNVLCKRAFAYDQKNNIIKEIMYDGKDTMSFRKSYFYKGNNIYEESSVDYGNPGSLDNFTATYTYKGDRLIEKEIKYKMGLIEMVKCRYEKDKLVEELYYDQENVPVKSKKFSYTENGDLREVSDFKIWMKKKYILLTKVDYEYTNM